MVLYIVGRKSLQAPVNDSYSVFLKAVSRILVLSDPKFLLYRPASGPQAKLICHTTSIEDDYHKLLNTGRNGVNVKIIEYSWFNSDVKNEVRSIQSNIRRSDSCKGERPVDTAKLEPPVVKDRYKMVEHHVYSRETTSH